MNILDIYLILVQNAYQSQTTHQSKIDLYILCIKRVKYV